MSESGTMIPKPQRALALQRANQVRFARAELKRRIAARDLSVGEIILACPQEVVRWPLGALLTSQPGWGRQRSLKFLARNQVSELKPVGQLTDRQRRLLATELGAHPAAHTRGTKPTER
jgi:hypothetical protein